MINKSSNVITELLKSHNYDYLFNTVIANEEYKVYHNNIRMLYVGNLYIYVNSILCFKVTEVARFTKFLEHDKD